MHTTALLLALAAALAPQTAPTAARGVPWWARAGAQGSFDAHGVERSLFSVGEVVVGHAPGRAAECEAALASLGAQVVQRSQGLDFLRVRLPDGLQPAEAIELFAGLSAVVAVERNALAERCSVPGDPLYHMQWSARLVSCERAWALTTGSPGVVVAVCDTGVAADLVELQGALVQGTSTSLFSGNTLDAVGHGTQMATLVAARRDNGVGGSGVAPGCRIMPVKVVSDTGSGSVYELAAGIQWAADHGARVILVSSATPLPSAVLLAAVQNALASERVVVASAGNSGSTAAHYPAAYPGVIGVAASKLDDWRHSSSNYGSWVALAAPASGVAAAQDGVSKSISGTSVAAAYLAGAAALLASHLGSGASQASLYGRLVGNADPVPGGWVLGRLNVYDALVDQHSTVVSNDFVFNTLEGSFDMADGQVDLMRQDTPGVRGRVDGVWSSAKKATVLALPVVVKTSPRGSVLWFDVDLEARSPTSTTIQVQAWDFQAGAWVALGSMALGPNQDTKTVFGVYDDPQRFYSTNEQREVHVRLSATAYGKYGPVPMSVEVDRLAVITRAKA